MEAKKEAGLSIPCHLVRNARELVLCSDNGVVGRKELELNNVAHIGLHDVRVELMVCFALLPVDLEALEVSDARTLFVRYKDMDE